jgi:hypothetical protein
MPNAQGRILSALEAAPGERIGLAALFPASIGNFQLACGFRQRYDAWRKGK